MSNTDVWEYHVCTECGGLVITRTVTVDSEHEIDVPVSELPNLIAAAQAILRERKGASNDQPT